MCCLIKCSSNVVTAGGVCQGGQVGDLQEPHYRWQLTHEPFINKVKYFSHIWWLLFLSISAVDELKLVMKLLSSENERQFNVSLV
jgi:hypothetical protein